MSGLHPDHGGSIPSLATKRIMHLEQVWSLHRPEDAANSVRFREDAPVVSGSSIKVDYIGLPIR